MGRDVRLPQWGLACKQSVARASGANSETPAARPRSRQWRLNSTNLGWTVLRDFAHTVYASDPFTGLMPAEEAARSGAITLPRRGPPPRAPGRRTATPHPSQTLRPHPTHPRPATPHPTPIIPPSQTPIPDRGLHPRRCRTATPPIPSHPSHPDPGLHRPPPTPLSPTQGCIRGGTASGPVATPVAHRMAAYGESSSLRLESLGFFVRRRWSTPCSA